MRHLPIAFIPSLALALAACADVQPVAPRARTPNAAEAAKGETKVSVCHHSEETNSYILISIAQPALAAHLAHGDGQPGERVPGQPGMRFGTNCGLQFVEGSVAPVAVGYIRDIVAPFGTIAVFVPPPPIIQVFRSELIPETEARGIVEFSIASIPGPVAHAELHLPIVGSASVRGGVGLFSYAGDGTVTVNDFASGSLVSFYPLGLNPPPPNGSITFDVTNALNTLIAAHASYAGFNLRIGFGSGVSGEGMITFSAGASDIIPHPTLTISSP